MGELLARGGAADDQDPFTRCGGLRQGAGGRPPGGQEQGRGAAQQDDAGPVEMCLIAGQDGDR